MGAILNLWESRHSTTTHTGKYSIHIESCTCSLPEWSSHSFCVTEANHMLGMIDIQTLKTAYPHPS